MKNGVVRLSALAEREGGGPPLHLYFDFRVSDEEQIDDSADPIAAALLIAAMRAGEALEIEQAISPRLHFNLPRIRDVFHTWWPDRFSRIEVRTSPRQGPASSPQKRAATFFSGGVDSFYSLLKLQRQAETTGIPLTNLIFMRGVETPLERSRGVDGAEERVKAVAESVGVDPIFGETNIRTCIRLHWEKYHHGSALAATALCLSPTVGHVGIGSSFSYNHLVAHGSTPLVDEMFSTERTYILHDGGESTRAKKVRRIVEWNQDLVLSYLRVCLRNAGGAFNCGRCRKCVRTSIPLFAMGLLDKALTFPEKGTSHWEAVAARDPLIWTEENLEFVRECGENEWLLRMLERVLERTKGDVHPT